MDWGVGEPLAFRPEKVYLFTGIADDAFKTGITGNTEAEGIFSGAADNAHAQPLNGGDKLNYHRLKDDGFVVCQRYFNDRSEGHPIYGVVVYADWTKPPALAGGDPYLHTYCYLKDDRLKDGGFNLITDE